MGRPSRRKKYDIWFRNMPMVKLSKRKMTEEDKDLMEAERRKANIRRALDDAIFLK